MPTFSRRKESVYPCWESDFVNFFEKPFTQARRTGLTEKTPQILFEVLLILYIESRNFVVLINKELDSSCQITIAPKLVNSEK